MTNPKRHMPKMKAALAVAAAALAFGFAARAEAPRSYAIKGARLVTVSGAPIASGTIVLRNGLIEAVGAEAQAPADAVAIDGAGMTVYPGLIDMGNPAGTDIQVNLQQSQQGARNTDEAERAKRTVILRPHVLAAEHVRLDAPELSRLAAGGVTSVLSTPPGILVKGQSALVNVTTPDFEPIVGAIAEPRAGLSVVRSPVALHVELQRVGGDGFPEALLGGIAFVRQSFIDAQYQQLIQQRYQKSPAGVARPPFDPALEAMQPALAGRLPVAFEAGLQREILRALDLAKEFKLSPIITGGIEADLAAADLKAANAKVLVSLNYPTRSRALPPDADEAARELRLRAHASKAPGGLAKAGVPFAFSGAGLAAPADFVKNAARAVRDGLPEDAAIRALTLDAAKIAGAGDRLGSLEKGKIANVIVTSGDLFNEATRIRYVFIDGRMVNIDTADAPAGRGGRGRGGQ
jgi:imidazolonepropionase-like amidohydrolase